MQENNKLILKNTLMLYFRQILIMLVGLYTVRVKLGILGVENFGIYNVVGGVVVIFSFLNTAMTSATQRFLNFAMGHSLRYGAESGTGILSFRRIKRIYIINL